MSVANLLQTLGIQSVPPVPPANSCEGTENTYEKQPRTPCPPCTPEKRRGAEQNPAASNDPQNPDALLLEIAPVLGADPAHLRAFLADSDLQDIIEGEQNRASLLAFYRLKQQTGELLAETTPAHTRAPQGRTSYALRTKDWQPVHGAFINHLMACRRCYAPRDRYCGTGIKLQQSYLLAYRNTANEK